MGKFRSSLLDKIIQDDSTNATHIRILCCLLLSNGFIASLLTTMWDCMDGFAKQYFCEYDIYLLLRLPL